MDSQAEANYARVLFAVLIQDSFRAVSALIFNDADWKAELY